MNVVFRNIELCVKVRWHLGRVPDIGLCSLICLLFYFSYSFSNPSSLAQALWTVFGSGLLFVWRLPFAQSEILPKSLGMRKSNCFLISNILSLCMSRIRRYILLEEQAEHSRVTGWFSVVTLQVVHSPNFRYKLDFKGVLQQNVPCQFFSRLEDSRLPCCLFICNCCLRTIIKYSYS